MIASYHTHTWRCMHADGTEREYIEEAIKGGLKILGFADHTPMPYDGGYVNSAKMLPSQLGEYVETILRLKEEYKNDIDIKLGLEVEYYPRYFERLLRLCEPYPIEYFLLGQHFLGNGHDDSPTMDPTDDPKRVERYFRQTKEALETGCFTYFAHPDRLMFTGDQEVYKKWMYELCVSSKEMDIPLEINFHGIWKHRNYPNPVFWKIAGEVGNTVIFGTDAHEPGKVCDPESLAVAQQIVKENNLKWIDTIEFRSPRMW